jgi:hypothetical protein
MTARSLTALLATSALLALAPAAAAGGTKPRQLTITANAAPWVVVGTDLGIKGGVSPRESGIRVTLEQRFEGEWLKVGALPVGPSGTFSFTTHPARAGLQTYRVVAAPGTGFVGGSNALPVQVLHWTYLSDIYAHPGGGDMTTDPMTSKGVTYQHDVALDAGCYNAWSGSAWVDYPLGHAYQTFTATVGLDDQAPSGTTATYAVTGDSKQLAAGSLVPGQVVKLDLSLSGVGKLRLSMNVPDPTGAAGCGVYFPHVVFGNAQFLGP